MSVKRKITSPPRGPLSILALLITVLAAIPSPGRDLTVLSSATFQRWATQLDQLEKEQKSGDLVAEEMVVARQWIEEGLILLGEGKVKNAALIAERMPLQVELIRVLLATGALLERAAAAEADVDRLGKTLLRLKSRYDRLILSRNGAEKSGAIPPVKK